MNILKKLFLLFILPFALVRSASALPWQEVPDPMKTRGSFVQDSAAILNAEEIQKLDNICRSLEVKTSIELAVVTIDKLEGLSVEEYAVKLFQRFGIGKKGKDNGVLILFALQDRKVRLEVGYGLEEVLTDAFSQQLLSRYAIPQFKKQQYAQGILALTEAVSETLGGERISRTESSSRLDHTSDEDADKEIQILKKQEREMRNRRIKNFFLHPTQAFLKHLIALAVSLLVMLFGVSLPQFLKKAQSAKLEYLRKVKVASITIFVLSIFALPFSIVFGFIRWIYPAFIFLPFLGLAVIFLYKFLKRSALNYRLSCPQCSTKMNLIPEYKDDQWLKDEEVDEEIAKGMDYEFWRCPQCDTMQRFNVKLGGASACPQCQRRSLVETSKVLIRATTSSSGLRERQEDCKNRHCDYFKQWQETIPRLSSSSGGGGFSSGSSSSSFGGGRSGGGGASGSW